MERTSCWRRVAALVLLAWLAACGGGGSSGGEVGGNGGATVASVVLSPGGLTVVPGGTASFGAEARDANGAAIAGVTFDWTSSDAAVATVAGGVATGVAAGTATIRASAGGVSSNAVTLTVRNAGTASSNELIDTALAAGEIDAETALAYKVFAVYLDPRLPAKYLGDDSDGFESEAVVEMRASFDTLSPAAQALLEPYLRRPADVGSWLDPAVRAGFAAAPRDRAQAGRERPLRRPTCGGTLDGWAKVDSANGKARVWHHTDYLSDGIAAHKVAGYIDANVWPVLINTLGFTAPLDDTTGSCDGGDGRLDIYMVVMSNRGETWGANTSDPLGSGYASPAYILINPNLSDDDLKVSTAHEVMHAIHWAYPSNAKGLANGWFRDGLANWAADQVFSGNVALNTMASCHFKSAELSLDNDAAGYCDRWAGISRNYGAYLPLQFLFKTRGGAATIKSILAATGGATTSTLEAVNSVVPFKSWWPDYARKLWNRDTVTVKDSPNTFDDWDQLTNVPRHTPMLAPDGRNNTDGRLNGSLEATTAIATDVANLSARYYRYTFQSDVNTRSVMFHNTFYDNWKNQQAVSVHAFFKSAGQAQWDEEDWTDVEWIGFCRDWKLQRLEELVVVVASAEWTGANPKVVAGQAPELLRNVIGCWQFEGEAKRTDTFASSGRSGTVVATFQAKYDGHPGNTPLQYTNRSEGKLRVPLAGPLFSGGNWTLFEQYTSGSCSYAIDSGGSSSSVTTGGSSTGLMIFNNFNDALPAGLRPEQVTGAPSLAYFVEGQTTAEVLGSVTGTDCGSTYKSAVGEWLLTQFVAGQGKRVDQVDGRLKGSLTVPTVNAGDSTVFTWDLIPVREP